MVGKTKARQWTNDYGMFVVSLVGLVVLVATYWNQANTSKRQLRAYLSISEGNLMNVSEAKQPSSLLRLSNRGQTPGYKIYAEGVLSTATLDQINQPRDLSLTKSISTGVIGPGGYFDITFHPDRPLSKEEYAAIEAGEMVVEVRVRITYFDAFKAKHFVSYHGYYRHFAGEKTEEPLKFDQAGEGNEAD